MDEEEIFSVENCCLQNESFVMTLAPAVKRKMAMPEKVLGASAAQSAGSGDLMMDQLRVNLPLKLANSLGTVITPLSKGAGAHL